ncbi:protein PRRC2C-like isoform X6 [Schistocerca americana]|uniref:protein PRRC2C-like isoform X6 n=1 Tax=Schistocerca americana TaxID=7009 RepID=UPI001F4F3D5D|nr:protein PRRC2C-like isoform X6 [Schistocerca americana]
MTGNYFDAAPEYQRTYRCSSLEYEKGQDYERKCDQPEAPKEHRDGNLVREMREKERDVRLPEESRELDTKCDVVDRHQPSGVSVMEKNSVCPPVKQTDDWHDNKDWKKSQEGDNKDWCEKEQDVAARRAGSCESRSSRDSVREEKDLVRASHAGDKQSRDFTWVDSTEVQSAELKSEKKLDNHREDRRESVRHAPGPITKEKLEASELRNDQKRGTLTQLMRSLSNQTPVPAEEIKQEMKEGQAIESEKNNESKSVDTGGPWQKIQPNNLEPSSTEGETVVSVPEKAPEQSKIWNEASPTAENSQISASNIMNESHSENEKHDTDSVKIKEAPLDESVTKAKENKSIESDASSRDVKRMEESPSSSELKTEKEQRNRSHTRQEQPRGRHSGYAVYRGGGWGQQRDSRVNRWGGSNRNVHNLRDEWTESEEISGDEVSASTESGKEDVGRAIGAPPRRVEKDNRRTPRSPKQNTKKTEKDERNRDTRRPEGEKVTQSSDSRRFEKRTYESARSGREGFAPRGEPSRRGRGGFRFRGSLGKRMDGYGPPSSKSPFGQPSEETKIVIPDTAKENQKNMEPVVNEINKDDLGGEIISNEDKIKQKQQVLSAGIIGSGVRHHPGANKMSGHIPPRMQRKSESERRDSSRSKGGNGSRGGGHGQGRTSQRAFGGPSNQNTHNFDGGDECWETTSENSETEDRERNVGTHNGKHTYPQSRDSHSMSRRAKNNKGGSGGGGSHSARMPVSEKPVGNVGNTSDNSGGGMAQRGASSQDNRSQNRGITNNPATVGNKYGAKELPNSVNKVDENKVNNSTIVAQAVNEPNSAKKKVEKDKTNALEKYDLNNYASVVIVDDQPEVTVEDGNFAFGADSGFQEVRSKKNVKEARQKGNSEDTKPVGRPPREKEPRKSKPGSTQQSSHPPPQQLQPQPQAQAQQTPLPQGLPATTAASPSSSPATPQQGQPPAQQQSQHLVTQPQRQGSPSGTTAQSVPQQQQQITGKTVLQQEISQQQVQRQPQSQQQQPSPTPTPPTQQQQQQQQQQPSQQPAAQQQRQQQQQQQQQQHQATAVGLQNQGSAGSGPPSTIAAVPTTSSAPTAPAAKFPTERQRQNKLPPRFVKQRMKMAEQQNSGAHVGAPDTSKQSRLFPTKDVNSPAPPPPVNAWTKPINASLRPNSPATGTVPNLQQLAVVLGSQVDHCAVEVSDQQPQSGTSSHRSTPNSESVQAKTAREATDKTVLDGTSPPVQTIIFENTNYKTAPPDLAVKCKFANMKTSRVDKSRDRKIGDDGEDSPLVFNKASGAIPDIGKNGENKSEAIQMPLTFSKNEDVVDMKLDFTFADSDLSQLTEDKTNKAVGMPRSMHLSQQVQSTISPSTAELNLKIQSVKKVWENVPVMPAVIEHTEDGSVASTASSFTPSFGNAVDSALDPATFVKGVEGCNVVTADENSPLNANEVVYSAGAALQGNASNYSGGVPVSTVPALKNDAPATSSNVCKLITLQVKPQQQPVMSAGPSPIGHSGPLSPPPFNSNTQQGHINYQPTLGGTAAQYGGISAIPSPPTVLYNSPGQGGLYAPFQIDGPQVMGGQARSQFSGFPPYGLSQGIGQTSAFNQQSLYLQTPAHPPPNAAPEIYQSSMSPFRLTAPQAPFGQSQQLSNNPNTVLISSTSNSLMSATVKPSSQQIGPIGAIGTKGGGPYQQNTIPSGPQPSQLFMYDPNQVMGQNYLPNSQMVQRPGPVQSNVVPPIPPSSSFYSGSAGGQTGFYQPTNSNLPQPASAQQIHQTGSPYGLQGFSNQSGTPAPVGLQGFGSQFRR